MQGIMVSFPAGASDLSLF